MPEAPKPFVALFKPQPHPFPAELASRPPLRIPPRKPPPDPSPDWPS